MAACSIGATSRNSVAGGVGVPDGHGGEEPEWRRRHAEKRREHCGRFCFQHSLLRPAEASLNVKHLDAVNEWIRKAGLRRRLVEKGDSLIWRYTSGNDLALDTMLWPVVESAAEIWRA